MARNPETSVTPAPLSPGRLWAEQLAIGLGLLLAVLTFMAFAHPTLLSRGGRILTGNDMGAYGWWALAGVILQLVLHEVGTVVVAGRLKLPLCFRPFPFGAHAYAILAGQPRRTWTDAVVGFAGPLTGAGISVILAAVYTLTDNPLFLGMACVGYFYNLFTLIPILDLEGGWVAPAIAPVAWLFGLVACAWELVHGFNLVLLCVVCFGVARLILLLRARAPQVDLECSLRQRLIMSIGYFAIVLALAWFGTSTFEALPSLVRDAMGD